jgi:virginiamycin B lyase
MRRLKFLLLALAACQPSFGQGSEPNSHVVRPGVKEVQRSFAELKPAATFKVGGSADWVLVRDDAVWVAGSKPYSVQRIDPAANKVVATIRLPGEACAGLEFGFGSLWVPLCTKKASLARVDPVTNTIIARLAVGPAGPEGGIAISGDSIWIVTDNTGTLARIDPATNAVRQTVRIAPGSFNPIFSEGAIWITGNETNVLTAVDAITGEVLATIPVGPKPRFLTAGGDSVWTLNQGDGTVSRVDAKSRKLIVTIPAGIPGPGGDICFGADAVWATVFDLPLTRIDPKSDRVVRQWVGTGGDSNRFGHDSIWLTDYHRGLLWRIPYAAAAKP